MSYAPAAHVLHATGAFAQSDGKVTQIASAASRFGVGFIKTAARTETGKLALFDGRTPSRALDPAAGEVSRVAACFGIDRGGGGMAFTTAVRDGHGHLKLINWGTNDSSFERLGD